MTEIFRNSSFSIEDSILIKDFSQENFSKIKDEMRQLLKNARGRVLATSVHTFHVPLANEAWKLTPLQETFLKYSDPDAPMIIESEDDLPGIKAGSLKDIAKQLDMIRGRAR